MPRPSLPAAAAVGAAVLALDQLSKAHVRADFAIGESTPLVDGFISLTRVHNTGAAFGIFPGRQYLLAAISVVVLVAIAVYVVRARPSNTLVRWGLTLVTSGALGNLIDRVLLGGVTDFFDLGWFPVFNVADIALDVGVALLVVHLLFGRHEAGAEGASDDRPAAIPATRVGGDGDGATE